MTLVRLRVFKGFIPLPEGVYACVLGTWAIVVIDMLGPAVGTAVVGS